MLATPVMYEPTPIRMGVVQMDCKRIHAAECYVAMQMSTSVWRGKASFTLVDVQWRYVMTSGLLRTKA